MLKKPSFYTQPREYAYEEGGSGLMQCTGLGPVMRLRIGTRHLVYQQIRKPGQAPYVIVFGWHNESPFIKKPRGSFAYDKLTEQHGQVALPLLRPFVDGRINVQKDLQL